MKLAEAEAHQQREKVTHLARVAILGQMSGALAHELNQPLTAILSNAQAAQQLLARGRIDSEDLRHILGDIVADDRRAGEVIARLRVMLRLPHMRSPQRGHPELCARAHLPGTRIAGARTAQG